MDDFIKILLRDNIQRAVNKLGLERTLETIQSIATPELRENLIND